MPSLPVPTSKEVGLDELEGLAEVTGHSQKSIVAETLIHHGHDAPEKALTSDGGVRGHTGDGKGGIGETENPPAAPAGAWGHITEASSPEKAEAQGPLEPHGKGKTFAEEEPDWDDTSGMFLGNWSRLIAHHYYLIFWAIVLLCLALSIFVVFGPPDERCTPGATQGQMTVCDQTPYDWSLPFHNASLHKDAYLDAIKQTGDRHKELTGAGSAEATVKPRTETSGFSVQFIFEHEDGKETTIFTPQLVKAMCETEAVVTTSPWWKFFCPLAADGECAAQVLSVSARFYPTEEDRDPAKGGCKLLGQAEVEARSRALMTNLLTSVNGFFANQAAEEGGFTNATRSMLTFGQPLEGFSGENDNRDDQMLAYRMMARGATCPLQLPDGSKFQGFKNSSPCDGKEDGTFLPGVEQLLFDQFGMKGVPETGDLRGALRSPYFTMPVVDTPDGGLKSRFYSGLFQQNEFERVVNGDLNFAILSVAMVYFYIWFHTKSAAVASASMFHIVISLPVGYFLYFNVLQYHYYSQMHILTIFLALGIGADSVFVYVDAWKESGNLEAIRTDAGRVHFSLSRTAQSCFNTTFTTVMSFVAAGLTPVMPIHAFAVFAGIVMTVNYFLVISFTPTIVFIYYVHLSNHGGCCCYSSRELSRCRWQEKANSDLEGAREKDPLYQALCMRSQPTNVVTPLQEEPIQRAATGTSAHERESLEKILSKLGAVERFLYHRYSPFITGGRPNAPFYRKPVACFLILAFLGYFAYMLDSASRLTPPKTEELWFPETHMHNADFFSRLANGWKGTADSAYMKAALIMGVEKMERPNYNWFFPGRERGEVTWDASFDLAKEEQQRFFLRVCDEVQQQDCDEAPSDSPCVGGKLVRMGREVTCPVRDVINFWKAAVRQGDVIPEGQFLGVFESFMGFVAQQGGQSKYKEVMGASKDKVLWAAVGIVTSADADTFSNARGHFLRDVFEELTERLRDDAPNGMRTLFYTDVERPGMGFTWTVVEDALVNNLFTGFMVCFPVVFAVLVFATGNFLLALYATLSIAMIVCDVLGAVQSYHKWDLGIAESIAGVIVIGFSVDYTVHLGHMYKEAWDQPSREEKTRFALTHMGGTVIGGGLTTGLSGAVLFLCTLQFFTKMGTLLCWTILLSMAHALLFFMACCAVIGPTGNWGSWVYLLGYFRKPAGHQHTQ
jgi:hypothetical protein